MANYPSLYHEILHDVYSIVGKKQVGEYTIEDTVKYLFEKYSPLIITQREFADHVLANDYKSYDLIETELDEPFLDFDNRVGIFELPSLSKWTTYLGADDVAAFILIAENGKLKDFWSGFNDFDYEPLKVALMIFSGYGVDFFANRQLLPLHHRP